MKPEVDSWEEKETRRVKEKGWDELLSDHQRDRDWERDRKQDCWKKISGIVSINRNEGKREPRREERGLLSVGLWKKGTCALAASLAWVSTAQRFTNEQHASYELVDNKLEKKKDQILSWNYTTAASYTDKVAEAAGWSFCAMHRALWCWLLPDPSVWAGRQKLTSPS